MIFETARSFQNISADFFQLGCNRYHSHIHYCYELGVCCEGEYKVLVDGEPFMLKKGDAVLILPNQAHSYEPASDSPALSACDFSVQYLSDFYQNTHKDAMRCPVITPVDTDIVEVIKMNRENMYRLKAIFYDIAARYMDNQPMIGMRQERSELIYRLINYIEDHFTEQLNLSYIATLFGYSYHHISELININCQATFSQLLNRYRVDYACQLLRETSDNITVVSQLCGYETTRSFNRNFRQITGVTPREYIARNRNVNKYRL